MTNEELLEALAGPPHGAIVPNAEQRSVMEHTGGPLWVIAGPGTGKTQGLVLRTLRLLCVDGVVPEAIVLTTFTRKAAEQLESRLHEVLRRLARAYPEVGQIDLGRMHLGTMHNICCSLLTASPSSAYRQKFGRHVVPDRKVWPHSTTCLAAVPTWLQLPVSRLSNLEGKFGRGTSEEMFSHLRPNFPSICLPVHRQIVRSSSHRLRKCPERNAWRMCQLCSNPWAAKMIVSRPQMRLMASTTAQSRACR